MNVFSAVRNLTNDQSLRVANDLARRLVLTIPGLAYQAELLPAEEQPILTAVEGRPLKLHMDYFPDLSQRPQRK